MLCINKITCAAALAVAPLALLGCGGKQEDPDPDQGGAGGDGAGDGGDAGLTVDKNGFRSDAAASTKAVGGILGNCIHRNECEGDERNTELIGKALTALVQHCEEAVGDKALVAKLLAEWKVGDEVPQPAREAANATCDAKVFPDDATADIAENIWNAEHRDAVQNQLRSPAVKEIRKAIKGALNAAGLDCDDAAVTEAFNTVAGDIDAQLGEGTVSAVAKGWNCLTDEIPTAIVDALNAYIEDRKRNQHS